MHISFVTVPILLCTMYNLFLSAGVVVGTEAEGGGEGDEDGGGERRETRAMTDEEKRGATRCDVRAL